jgi:GPH family glycoside/pentoside/hexuronide:cation symporter
LKQKDTSDKIPPKTALAYGVGGVAENMVQNGVQTMANPIYNVGLLVNPALLGVAMAIFRLWDAFTDPIMGIISDRTQTRWGRRRPFVLVGSILASMFFMLIWWMPMGQSEMFYFFYFLFSSIAFFTAATIFGVPYLAMGYELSAEYHERTKAMAYRTWFASIAGIIIQWLFWFTQRDMFENTVEGMRYVGIGAALVLMITGCTTAILVRDKSDRLKVSRKQIVEPIPGIQTIREVLSEKPFLIILTALTLAILGLFTVGGLGFYINVYYVYGGDMRSASTILGFAGTFYHLCCLASIPMVSKVSRILGKRKALMLFLSLAVFASLAKWFLYTPAMPYLQLLVVAMLAPGLSAVWTLLASMTADVTDVDEYNYGLRREGSFSSFYSWTMKFGFAICFMIGGYILVYSGFNAALGEHQTESAIRTMRILFSVVPAIGLLGTILCIYFFPITEQKAREIRKLLDQRRAKEEES